MKNFVKHLLGAAGIYYAKRQYMLRGIDWPWDIKRLMPHKLDVQIIDVGANIGQTVTRLKKLFPNASIDAFEPVKATFERLRDNVRHMNGVRCHHAALSDKSGSGRILVKENSQLSHLIPDGSRATEGPAESVDLKTIDQFCEDNGLRKIDILKVDTEGWDLNVLRGAIQMLSARRVQFVLVEVGFNADDSDHGYYPEIFEFLQGTGMFQYCFYDYYFENQSSRLLYCNALFSSQQQFPAEPID